ncbi:precorrin-8X methylmutase [Heliorestis acidaminivorans]|uniref:Precorrin-8X methylmutase n=1 Tax=Heliorestis acidaminivorans TaxID=553427 RepID=A0A6I0EZU0_9FIRM|nr:precorrin-8X methylmutase [Heliorestis acidaminivorans]KAB2954186.1 precorrin-8X methylmutase [Heliorestis acidaminivorans]
MEYITNPQAIEDKSMAIIANQLGPLKLSEAEQKVVMRVVHTTGDVDIAPLVKFHPSAVTAGIEALSQGASIYCDVNMVLTGINKKLLQPRGGQLLCAIHDETVIEEAKRTGETRAMTAFRLLAPQFNGAVIAIGNAPTALFELIKAIEAGICRPALIVGVPVGFVGAAESKELLSTLSVPYITIEGTKGGSTVAVAIINSLLLQMP